jgi:hydroxymethylglutaryl-CoA reductase
MARLSGGFTAASTDPILIGQVQVVNVDDPDLARERLLAQRDEILALANSMHPKMVARGGGALDIEVHRHHAPEDGREMVVVHLLVDTRDAMGANMVNTMCEGIASLVETITGGKVFLRILSNLTDRAIATATVRIPAKNLEGKGFSGEEVRDGIILANDLASVDPYRAATHNKGIMNGVDAVVIATGNDWRAIEAGAHAYAVNDGVYTSLSTWGKDGDGNLVGSLEMPMAVGIVGGATKVHPTAQAAVKLMDVKTASELAEIIVSVGLAQNLAALRALATEGIQRGHMSLHARQVAIAAGAEGELVEKVAAQMVAEKMVRIDRAEEILKK